MRFTNVALALATMAATGVDAKTLKVTVGKDSKLVYDPPSQQAEIGDEVEFTFYAKNHTVSQSTFGKPCDYSDSGFFSGFNAVAEKATGPTFTIKVTDNKPIWFFCGQGQHCKAGMVGAINAPTTGNTFEAFKEAAAKVEKSVNPTKPDVKGGVLSSAAGESKTVTLEKPASTWTYTTTKTYETSSAGKVVTVTTTATVATSQAATTVTTVVNPNSNPSATNGGAAATPSPSKAAGPAITAPAMFNALNAGAALLAAAAFL